MTKTKTIPKTRYRFDPAADDMQKELYTKFPAGHFLSDPKNVDHILKWNTFFRQNYDYFAKDWLKIKLYDYQDLMLHELGANDQIVIVAARATAKSFIIALYACIRCILYPYTKVLLSSASKGQSELIVSEKIRNELMEWYPMLANEIDKITESQHKTVVYFKNKSRITVVVASERARGNRSNCIVREEFRMMDKYIDDSVLSPCQVLRHAPYMNLPYYANMEGLKEEAADVYISSSWFDNGHWMWQIVDNTIKQMKEGKRACFLAFDESVVLQHKIKSRDQLIKEKHKQDPLTWRIEFLNERVKENKTAFFTFAMLQKNQRSKQPFYPRTDIDVRIGKKNPYAIPKQKGEVRVISCDMAFVTGKNNDNSVFSCIRLLPECTTYTREGGENITEDNGYRRVVPYLEPLRGGEIRKQAIRIRQLYEDFEADYIVLDMRNAGVSIYDQLARVMYDEDRGIEYSALSCMNDDSVAQRIKVEGANPCIFIINASQNLNSAIAQDFQRVLSEQKIDFLISFAQAKDEVLAHNMDYLSTPDGYVQAMYEAPFLQTQKLISETTSLVVERKAQSGAIVVSETAGNRKDRYTSVSYGSYFATLLEKDLMQGNEDYEYCTLVN